MPTLDKEEVAARQLDAAIEMLFAGEDIVSVHTLACAASTVFADLLHAKGVKAWRDHIVECFPGREREVTRVQNKARNFFKHADRDPDEKLEFNEVDNDEVIIVATLEYGELLTAKKEREKLSTPMSVFQMWYFVKAPEVFRLSQEGMGDHIVAAADHLFPNLGRYPRFRQLAMGAEVLKDQKARNRGE